MEDRRLRRVGVIWTLLFFDVIGANGTGVIHVPHKAIQLLTQGSLFAALILALSINPRCRIRPNLFLGIYSVLAVTTVMMSVRFVSLGTTYRSIRLVIFVGVLWLLTPWFGRRDLFILRTQVRILIGILITVWLGFMMFHGKAYGAEHRLSGVLWTIPPTQVAHYLAELLGLIVLLAVCDLWSRRRVLIVVIPILAALLLTHTRTALLASALGLVVAGVSLFVSNRRVRRASLVLVLVVGVLALGPSSTVTKWLERGQSSSQIHNLTGRTNAWHLVLSNPRPLTNKILGSGLSNDGVYYQANIANDGLPIDSSWIATYQNQGIQGDVLDGAVLLTILLTAGFRRNGAVKALALFLGVYCLVASFTETGLGEASPYLLDLTVAASLLATPDWGEISFGRFTIAQ
jgi:hypothetical protein